MLYERVLEQAMYVSERSVYDYLFYNNISITLSNNMNEEAYLFIEDGKATIKLKDDLKPERAMYAILHEIGHYALDIEGGVYSFTLEFDKSRSEFKANLFACFCLLKNVDIMDLNVIQFLINKGCPERIAIKVFEYMQQNMENVLKTH